jgi:hypothetical protein
MTLDEFRALKAGDRVSCPMAESAGKVTAVGTYRTGTVVTVNWDGAVLPRNFSEHTTAWMHWSKA